VVIGLRLESYLHHQILFAHRVLDLIRLDRRHTIDGGCIEHDRRAYEVPNRHLGVRESGAGTGIYGLENERGLLERPDANLRRTVRGRVAPCQSRDTCEREKTSRGHAGKENRGFRGARLSIGTASCHCPHLTSLPTLRYVRQKEALSEDEPPCRTPTDPKRSHPHRQPLRGILRMFPG
jgi:hypothetical protein